MARRKIKPTTSEVGIDFGAANPKQAQFYASKALYTAFGGARGGGKSHAVRVKSLAGAVEWPGIKILIIRRTYNELHQNHIEPLTQMIPTSIARYNGSLRTIYFVNGSTIRFGHWQGMSTETEYRGQEYDWIFIDEATEFSEMEFRMLGGCLRGVNKIPKRMYLTCNPGGVGHRWVKRLFIDRQFKDNENPKDYAPLIFATVEDNTALTENSPAYISMLDNLPENIRAAHRYGDWDSLSGNYLPEFKEGIHTCKPFLIPDDWVKYRAFDYGLDMLACLWIAVDYDERCWVFRELNQKNLAISDAAELMQEHTLPQERISITFAPPDMWNRRQETGKSAAETFALSGLSVVKAPNSRVQGWLQLKELFKIRPDGKPGLIIFDNCKEIIDNIQNIQADDKNPSDCAKEPHDVTHAPDALRYFAQSRTLPSVMEIPQEPREYDALTDYDEFMTGGEATASYINY